MKLDYLQHHVNHDQKRTALDFLKKGQTQSAIGALTRTLDRNPTDSGNPHYHSPQIDSFETSIHSDAAFHQWFFLSTKEANDAVFSHQSTSQLSDDFIELLALTPDEAAYFIDTPDKPSCAPLRLALYQAYVLGLLSSPIYEKHLYQSLDETTGACELFNIDAQHLVEKPLESHSQLRYAIASQHLMQNTQGLEHPDALFCPTATLKNADHLFEKMAIADWHTDQTRHRDQRFLSTIISHIPEIKWGRHHRTTRNLDSKVRAYADRRQSMTTEQRIKAVNKITQLIERRNHSTKYLRPTTQTTIQKKKQLQLLSHLFSYELNALNHPLCESFHSACHHNASEIEMMPQSHPTPPIRHQDMSVCENTTMTARPLKNKKRSVKTIHRHVRDLQPALMTTLPLAASTVFALHHHPHLAVISFCTAFLTRSGLYTHSFFSPMRKKSQRHAATRSCSSQCIQQNTNTPPSPTG